MFAHSEPPCLPWKLLASLFLFLCQSWHVGSAFPSEESCPRPLLLVLVPTVLSSERPRLDFCSRWMCPSPPILCRSPNSQHLRMCLGEIGPLRKLKQGYLGGPRSNLSGVLIRIGNLNTRKRYQRHTNTEQRPCEDPMRRWPSASQRARPQEKPSLPVS